MKPIQSVPDTERRGARAVAPERQTTPSAATIREHRRFRSHSPSERHPDEWSQTEPGQSLPSSAHLTAQRVTRLGVARNTPWTVINGTPAAFTYVQGWRIVASSQRNRTVQFQPTKAVALVTYDRPRRELACYATVLDADRET